MSHEGIRILTPEEHARESQPEQPLSRGAVTPAKVRVLISEGKGLEIDWADGHQSAWNFAWLRNACPCATCIDERKQQGRKAGQPKAKPANLLPMYEPPTKAVSAHAVGRYALQINWSDGHSSGIYSWDYLRRHCPCRECTFAGAEMTGTPQ